MRLRSWLRTWQQSAWPRRLALAGGGLLGCFVVANLLLGVIFWHRLYPNTRVGGHAVGAVSYSAAAQKVGQLKLIPATVTLQQPGHSAAVTPHDLGIAVDTAKIVAQAKHRSWLPLQNVFSTHNTPVYTTVNQKILAQKLAAVASGSKQDPTNARIVVQDNQFVLAGAVKGSQLDITGAEAVIARAVTRGQGSIKLPMRTIAPIITAASLQTNLHQLQAGQAIKLSYIYAAQTAQPSAAIIAGWYAQDGNTYTVQTGRIQAYISQVGAADGIRVQNLAQAVSATRQALQAAKQLAFTLVAVPPGVCTNNSASQLVVVSISQQHMWACEGFNQVYDTAITSGAAQAGTPTPTGTWHIYAKRRNINLTGPTWDDFVSYWLPFYADYGFHDASWQLFPFGDPAYVSQGSHGCVHLPTPAMGWLYNWSRVGTAVTITG